MTQAEKDPRQALFDEIARCGPWLQAALDHGGSKTHTLGDIYNGIQAGSLHLWPADDAAVVTEFVNYPQERHIHVFLIGGNLDTVNKIRLDIEKFGVANGCSCITGTGRPGWGRQYRDEGYTTTLHTVVKRLDPSIVKDENREETP